MFNNQTELEAAAKLLDITDDPVKTKDGDFLFYEIKGDLGVNREVANNQLYDCYTPKEKPLEREIGNDIKFKLIDIKNIAKDENASESALAIAKKELQSLEKEIDRRRNLYNQVKARTFVLNGFSSEDARLKPQTVGVGQNTTRLVMYMKKFDELLEKIYTEPLGKKLELNSKSQSPDSTAST